MQPSELNYNYNDAGFDNFLSRSIDNVQQATLDSPGPRGNILPLDRMQTSGFLSDLYRVGDIVFDGKGRKITVSDGQNVFLYIGPRAK